MKLPGQCFKLRGPADVIQHDGSHPLKAVRRLLKRLGIPASASSVTNFLPPTTRIAFSSRFPGLLTKYIEHEVHVELTMDNSLPSWSVLPSAVVHEVNSARASVLAAANIEQTDDMLHDAPIVIETQTYDAQGPANPSAKPSYGELGEPNVIVSSPSAPASRWAQVRASMKGIIKSKEMFLWMRNEEIDCYQTPQVLAKMENRVLLMERFSESCGDPEVSKKWVATALLEGAMNGHTLVMQKCITIMKREGIEVDFVHAAIDSAIAGAAKQYQRDAVRLLVHYHLDHIRKFLDMRNIRDLSPNDRAKLEQHRLQHLIKLTAHAGDSVSTRHLLQLGNEIGVPMQGLKLCSWNLHVNRTFIELNTDLSFMISNSMDAPELHTLETFLKQFVKAEMHSPAGFLNVLDFVANCQLPLHQCCCCATVLFRMKQLSVSQRDCGQFQRFADMFMAIIVRALDECTTQEQSRRLLQQQDASTNDTPNTVSQLAIVGKLSRVIEHHSFQALALADLHGMSRYKKVWSMFDGTVIDSLTLHLVGMIWRTLVSMLLTGYLIIDPLVVPLSFGFSRIAVVQQDLQALVKASYFKVVSSAISYLGLVIVLVIRSQAGHETVDESSKDGPSACWIARLASAESNRTKMDTLIIFWSLSFFCQNLRLATSLFSKRNSRHGATDDAIDAIRLVSFAAWVPVRIFACGDAHLTQVSEQILGLFSMLSIFRFFTLFKMHQRLGPLWFCMKALLVDLFYFLLVLFLMLFAFWIALEYVFRAMLATGTERDVVSEEEGTQSVSSLGLVVWTTFGEFALGNDYSVLGNRGETTFSDSLVHALLFGCLLINSVVLVNLLIAMMNNTFQQYMIEADAQRNTEVFFFLEQYKAYPVLPPPLNLIEALLHTARWVSASISPQMKRLCSSCKKEESTSSPKAKVSDVSGNSGQTESPRRKVSISAIVELAWAQRGNHVVSSGATDNSGKSGSSSGNNSRRGSKSRITTIDEPLSDFRTFALLEEQEYVRQFMRTACRHMRDADSAFDRQRQDKIFSILEHRLGFCEIHSQLNTPDLPEWVQGPALRSDWQAAGEIEAALKTFLPPAKWEIFQKYSLRSDAAKDLFKAHQQGRTRLDIMGSNNNFVKENNSGPRLVRTMRALQIVVRHESKELYLFEIYEVRSDGTIRVLNRLPQIQLSISTDEMAELTDTELQRFTELFLHRKLHKVEGRLVELINLVHHTKHPRVTVSDSVSFPGIPTRYITFYVECVVTGLPEHDFMTLETVESDRAKGNDANRSHHWKWMTEEKLVEVLNQGNESGLVPSNSHRIKFNGVTSQKLDKIMQNQDEFAKRVENLEGSLGNLESMMMQLLRHSEIGPERKENKFRKGGDPGQTMS